MARTRRLQYEVLRSINSSTFTGSFQALGAPLLNPASIVKIVNASNVSVTISIDGVNNHDICPANSFVLYDETGNSPEESGSIYIPQGTQYYVNGSAGTGSVYLVVQFIQNITELA